MREEEEGEVKETERREEGEKEGGIEEEVGVEWDKSGGEGGVEWCYTHNLTRANGRHCRRTNVRRVFDPRAGFVFGCAGFLIFNFSKFFDTKTSREPWFCSLRQIPVTCQRITYCWYQS